MDEHLGANGIFINFKLHTNAQSNVLPETVISAVKIKPQGMEDAQVELRVHNGMHIATQGVCEVITLVNNRVEKLQILSKKTTLYSFSKHNIKIVLGNYTAKIGKKNVWSPTIGSESPDDVTNNNEIKLNSFATYKMCL